MYILYDVQLTYSNKISQRFYALRIYLVTVRTINTTTAVVVEWHCYFTV